MASPAKFESLEKELGSLVAKSEEEHADVTSPGYGLTEEIIALVEGSAR